jgi:MoaA/NifB/PqqE/SkfB family radical SAM enzyme
MKATILNRIVSERITGGGSLLEFPDRKKLNMPEKELVWIAIRIRIFLITLVCLRSISKTIKTFRHLNALRKQTWGGKMRKIYKVAGKYYFNLYTPGWPSKAYDKLIRNEVQRYDSPTVSSDQLRFIFLAVTRKCPMRCEHCFEWENLNQRETFSREELIRIVDIYQKQGVNQIQFSGGEPMVRFPDLLEIIRFASVNMECYVVTSGFNLTPENARLLKAAGCKGMIISIDHHIPEMHNRFRGHRDIFTRAVDGVRASLEADMITALSVCVTREFLDGANLLPYLRFAHTMGVHFVQILEPKAVGHYAGKDVLLDERHICMLEEFFKEINQNPVYSDFPSLMYHGYHQRRIGCYAGSRSLYIDSAGDVHACPFCHTRSYNVRELLNAETGIVPVKENRCPRYGKVV